MNTISKMSFNEGRQMKCLAAIPPFYQEVILLQTEGGIRDKITTKDKLYSPF